MTSHQKFFEGTNLEGGGGGDKIFRPMKMLVYTTIVLLLFRIGVNSPGGLKIHQVRKSETVKCVRSNS